MPLYVFKCEKCGEVFDKLCRYEDKEPPCPKCGESSAKQVTSPGAFEIDGDGVYKPGRHVK